MRWLITVAFSFWGSDSKFFHLLNSWVWKSLWIMLTLISQSSAAEIRSCATLLQNSAFWESLSNLWCRWLLQISFFSYMMTFYTMPPRGCAFDRFFFWVEASDLALTSRWLQFSTYQLKQPLQNKEKKAENLSFRSAKWPQRYQIRPGKLEKCFACRIWW